MSLIMCWRLGYVGMNKIFCCCNSPSLIHKKTLLNGSYAQTEQNWAAERYTQAHGQFLSESAKHHVNVDANYGCHAP